MLRFLLDSHGSPRAGAALRAQGVDAVHLVEWRDGRLLHAPDMSIILAAATEQRIFVTSDRKTVTPGLQLLWEDGRHHAGVIFMDRESLPQGDIGAIQRAILRVVEEAQDWDWTDRVLNLRPDRRSHY